MSQEKVWDSIAREWAVYRKRISPTVEKFINESSGKILDLGCGSGRNFLKTKDLEWFACDFSKEMIKEAKKNAEEKEMEVELKICESDKLVYEDNFFDSILCFAVLHCIDKKEKRANTIKEIYRILKPTGIALISSWGKKSPQLKNKTKECIVTWNTKEKNKQERYTYIFELDELVDLCKKAGFEIISSFEERNVNVLVKKP